MIASGMSKLMVTTIGAKMFGRICFDKMRRSDAPIDRAAVTYVFSLVVRVRPWTRRAN